MISCGCSGMPLACLGVSFLVVSEDSHWEVCLYRSNDTDMYTNAIFVAQEHSKVCGLNLFFQLLCNSSAQLAILQDVLG